jgi:disulfide bond formation protein DsbB
MTTSTTPLSKLVTFLQQYSYQLAFGPAVAALLGSLYFSEIAKFIPCTLCWYQRILMYPLVIIIIVGVLTEDKHLPKYVLPLSLLGLGVAGYHYLLQIGVFGRGEIGMCTVGVPCNARYINYFGFVTIPFLSLVAFTLISGLVGLGAWAKSKGGGVDEEGDYE